MGVGVSPQTRVENEKSHVLKLSSRPGLDQVHVLSRTREIKGFDSLPGKIKRTEAEDVMVVSKSLPGFQRLVNRMGSQRVCVCV